MVVVEAVDELLAVDVALVLGAGVPERDVGVDDEVALAVLGVHERLRFPVTGVTSRCERTSERAGWEPRQPSQSETPARVWRPPPGCNVGHTEDEGGAMTDGHLPQRARLHRTVQADLPGVGDAPTVVSRPAARLVAAQRGLRRPAGVGRAGVHRHPRRGVAVLRVRARGPDRAPPDPRQRADLADADRRRRAGAQPAQRGLLAAAGAGRGAPGAGVRLRRADRRHQRAGAGARRPGAHGRPRRGALLAEPVHLHVRGGPGARPADRSPRGVRQPDHLVEVLQRPAPGAGPVGRRATRRR